MARGATGRESKMPEFVLDHGSPESARVFRALDSFTQGYIEAMFFTDEEQLCEESGREMPSVAFNLETMESRFVGGDSPGFGDLAPAALTRIMADCAAFQAANEALLSEAMELVPGEAGFKYGREALNDERLGQLFWYARNGHGVAFTDDGNAPCLEALQRAGQACGGVWSCVGDDGLIYLS